MLLHQLLSPASLVWFASFSWSSLVRPVSVAQVMRIPNWLEWVSLRHSSSPSMTLMRLSWISWQLLQLITLIANMTPSHSTASIPLIQPLLLSSQRPLCSTWQLESRLLLWWARADKCGQRRASRSTIIVWRTSFSIWDNCKQEEWRSIN